MKRRLIFQICVLALLAGSAGGARAQSGEAGLTVRVHDRVSAFAARAPRNTAGSHRSGLADAESGRLTGAAGEPEFSRLIGEESCPERVHARTADSMVGGEEWEIRYAESHPLLQHFMEKRLPKTSYTVNYDEYFHEYKIVPTARNTGDTRRALSLDELRKESDRVLRRLVPFLEDKVEYDNHRVTYEEGKKVESALFIYRRLFRGGIVDLSVSSLEVVLDGEGNLQSINLKWPTFRRAGAAAASLTVGPEEATRAAVQDVVRRFTLVRAWGRKDEMRAKSAELSGMAFGWAEVETGDGVALLTPSYTYSTRIKYSDDVELNPVIDIPLLRKYW
jgi:hypothetical protein